MEKILKSLATPFLFLANKGGFATLLGYISAAYLYANLNNRPLYGLKPIFSLLTTGSMEDQLTGWVIWILIAAIYYLVIVKSPLKKINTKFINLVSCVVLALALMLIYWKAAAFILLLLAIIWLASELGGYGTVFDYTGRDNPWDGRFATSAEIRSSGLKQEEGIILGIEKKDKAHADDFIRFNGEGNVACFAAVGKSKTSGPVMANALTYSGSIIINDPKSEVTLRSLYARANLLNQNIKIIDTFGECEIQVQNKLAKIRKLLTRLAAVENHSQEMVKKLENALKFYESILPRISLRNGDLIKGINPMQVINQLFVSGEYDKIYAEANVLADILVVKTNNDKEAHWDEKAKMILRNAILFITFSEVYADEPKNLLTVRSFVLRAFSSAEILETVIAQCSESVFSIYLGQIEGEFSLIGAEERNSVLSNVLKHTEFLDDPFVKKSVSNNDCDLTRIKYEFTTVYLILPLTKISAYSRLSRLWIATIIQTLMHNLDEPEKRVLLMLDEVAQLGHLDPLEKGISYLRQYGVNMYLIFQDLSQLKSIYGNKWETILANCRYKQFLGASDQTTADYVSKETGQKTLTTKGNSFSSGSSKSEGVFSRNESSGYSTNVQSAPVLRPDEVRRSPFQYIIPDEGFPIEAARLQYFTDAKLINSLAFNLPKELKDI